MKEQKAGSRAFTLIEMLVVIAIIGLLAAILIPAITSALAKGQEKRCTGNLRGLGMAWASIRMDYESNPTGPESDSIIPWLSALVPEYMDGENMFICPADRSGGRNGGKPIEDPRYQAALARILTSDNENYPETDDIAGNNHPLRNQDIEVCSYLYEFSAAECSWWSPGSYILGPGSTPDNVVFATLADVDLNEDGVASWGEVKIAQQRYGDQFMGKSYDENYFPIIRCFHHHSQRTIFVNNTDGPAPVRQKSLKVLNAAMTGRVFITGLKWEHPIAGN